jgi:hypothetical protein
MYFTNNNNINNLVFKEDIWKNGLMIDTFVDNFKLQNSIKCDPDEAEACCLFFTKQMKLRGKVDLEEIDVKVPPLLLEKEENSDKQEKESLYL